MRRSPDPSLGATAGRHSSMRELDRVDIDAASAKRAHEVAPRLPIVVAIKRSGPMRP